MNTKYGFIYITTNMINGRKYIGQRTFRKGWEIYLGSGTRFIWSLKKHGRENFSREIIAIALCKEELNSMEIETIRNHGAATSDDYYNISFGGESTMAGLTQSSDAREKIRIACTGRIKSPETRARLSISNKGNKNTLGKNHSLKTRAIMSIINSNRSLETRKKISDVHKGMVNSPKTRAKIGKSNKGKIMSPAARMKISAAVKGRIVSDETKAKISKANKGKIRGVESRANMSAAWSPERYSKMCELQSNRTPEHQLRLNESQRIARQRRI